MRRFLAGWLVLLSNAMAAAAQVTSFPYEAVVESDTATIHSGPGSRQYYATGQLERGERVTVVRHDPGGWYMIAPPPGSFSWIRAEYVQRLDARRGELKADNVVVRVGSALANSADIEQVRLSSGDVVEILGEGTLNIGPAPAKVFKISPPRGEFRWIAGRDVAPAEPSLRDQHDQNPFAVPSTARRDAIAGNSAERGRPATSGTATPEAARGTGPAVRHSGPAPDKLLADRQRLADLDERFRSMVSGEIATWNLDQLDDEYRNLKAQASHPALAGQIDLRRDAVARYRRRKQTWDEVLKLTSETARRDADLLATYSQQTAPPAEAGPSIGSPPNGSWQPTAPPQPGATIFQGQTLHRAGRPAIEAAPSHGRMPAGRMHAAPPQAAPPRTGFDGAGIIQRAATTYPGAPRYVLLAPDGRVLAYLQAGPGVALEPAIGRPMGLLGQRVYRADLQSDLLIVRGMSPVQLAP